MSRTRKDMPHNIRFQRGAYDLRPPRGSQPKKKRSSMPEYDVFWCSNPSWFTHLYMTKRRRRENRIFEAIIKTVPIDSLSDYEPHLNWKKPVEYYW